MNNMTLPGNPRYQPKSLQAHFGYDNLFRAVAEVEIATMRTLAEIGIIPPADIVLLTPELEQKLLEITTTEVDKVEREITKHDIRAWVRLAQERLPLGLRRWVHIPLTSYDALDTARALQFARAHDQVVRPLTKKIITHFAAKTGEFASQQQIGRTHGQHALPITVGFWLATILNRILCNAQSMDLARRHLAGKISGAVGAYNAQVATGIVSRSEKKTIGERSGEEVATGAANLFKKSFEDMVLDKLGLTAAPISTQITPPEPLADYLFGCVKMSATFGQFGRDGRHLMRSEIAELGEPFDKGQVGSSTMAHKRNPINFENLESTWLKNKIEFGKVMETFISEHQRDLVNSAISRDFPTIVVNLVSQMETLLREKDGVPFITRISVDVKSCARNFALQGGDILAEPVYIALQMAGYTGDAHELVNHQALKHMKDINAWTSGTHKPSLVAAVSDLLRKTDPTFAKVWQKSLNQMNPDRLSMLTKPEKYIGLAREKALQVQESAAAYLAALQ